MSTLKNKTNKINKDEYDALYKFLYSLSSKVKSNSDENTESIIDNQEIDINISPQDKEIKVTKKNKNKFNKITTLSTLVIDDTNENNKYSFKLETNNEIERKEDEIERKKDEIERKQIKDNEEKEKIKCKACLKEFTTEGSIIRHYDKSEICRKYIVANHTSPEQLKPIHLMVSDCLDKAVTGDKELQCRFCGVIFTNKGNHHKHYYSAIACNRLAHIEFKKIISCI